jgi:hypothetical protein
MSDRGTIVLRSALKSQYHAALAMLRQAITRCPDKLWSSRDHANPFWRIAYHTLYATHLYLGPGETGFRPWEHHETGIQDLDDVPAPPELLDALEPPRRPPQTGEPYTKAQVIEYWGICDAMVDGAIDALDLLDDHCGFSWHTDCPRAVHQIMSIRHIQHHTAQLSDRLRAVVDIGVEWVRIGPRSGL